MIATQKPKSTKVPPTPTPIPPTPVPVVTLGGLSIWAKAFGLPMTLNYGRSIATVATIFLQSRNHNGCNIMYQFGHGMDMNTFEVNSFSKHLEENL